LEATEHLDRHPQHCTTTDPLHVRLSLGLRRDPIKRIDHFLDQFAAPMANWCQTLGNPTLTSEWKEHLAKGIAAGSGRARHC
jgi:hypothetical protein